MREHRELTTADRRLEAAVARFVDGTAAIADLLFRPAASRPPNALATLLLELAPCRRELQVALRGAERAVAAAPECAVGPARRAVDPATVRERIATAAQVLEDWPRIAATLARAADPVPTPLVAPRSAGPEALQFAVLERAFTTLDEALAPHEQDAAAAAHGCHGDIRLSPRLFLACAHAAWRLLAAHGRLRAARFLDVGCGAGTKVLLASHFFAAADGIEFDPGHAAAAARLLGTWRAPRTRVLPADALGFAGYADYDVVYCYQPMRDLAKLRELETRIATSVRPGTVLVFPYPSFCQRASELGVALVDPFVGLAATSTAEAAALREHAERTGSDVAAPETWRVRAEEGPWAPVRLALRLNGFDDSAGPAGG